MQKMVNIYTLVIRIIVKCLSIGFIGIKEKKYHLLIIIISKLQFHCLSY